MKLCLQCSRSMRLYQHVELYNKSLNQAQLIRSISTSSIRRQAQSTKESIPPPIPTTTPTITSNVTAPAPPKTSRQSSESDASGISTSQMQKRITQNLTTPPSMATAITNKLAAKLLKSAKSSTESYATYGITEIFFKSCAAQAAYTIPEDQRMGIYTGKGPPKNAREEDVGIPDTSDGYGAKGADSWWFKTMGFEPTFSVWSQVCFLHMYIITTKLRTLDSQKTFLDYQRYLLEHFSNAAEDKMALLHGMNAKGIRNRYLKDLFVQWRGILYAYDQGLVSGDAVLAAAVWRNLWKADENVDWEKVAMVVSYMRRCIAGLESADVKDIAVALKQGSPYWTELQAGVENVVQLQSRGIREPLKDEIA